MKVTSGIYNELINKLRKLERTVETLHRTTTEIKAEMVDVTSKSREATQDTDLEQNGASLNIHLETSTTKHSSSYRESPKSLVDQMERSRKRNSELMEENNNLIKGMFSKNTKKKRKIYLAWEERMAHLLKLNCLTWKGENVINGPDTMEINHNHFWDWVDSFKPDIILFQDQNISLYSINPQQEHQKVWSYKFLQSKKIEPVSILSLKIPA